MPDNDEDEVRYSVTVAMEMEVTSSDFIQTVAYTVANKIFDRVDTLSNETIRVTSAEVTALYAERMPGKVSRRAGNQRV